MPAVTLQSTLSQEEKIEPVQREASVPGTYVNFDRAEVVRVGGVRWRRLALKTPLVHKGDDLTAILSEAAGPFLEEGDILVVTEKVVAIAQGRAMPVSEIRPSGLARLLSRFVTRTPYGIGLAMPETMECALRECGRWKILIAAAAGAVGKLLGKKGWFYRIAGIQAAGIDGPCACTIPPYNRWVVLSPQDPGREAEKLFHTLREEGYPLRAVVIADCNDLGGELIGQSGGVDLQLLREILADNPLGQGDDQTPAGIVCQSSTDSL